MNVWNKVLLGLIAVVSVVLFYFCTRAMKAHQVWEEAVVKHEAALKSQAKQQEELLNGADGLRELRVKMAQLTTGQGRLWVGAKWVGVNPQAGTVTLSMAVPPTAPNIQVFAFAEPTQQSPKGEFLGEFTITGIQNGNVQLQPARLLTESQSKLVQLARPWTLHEVLPAPRSESPVLAAVAEEKAEAPAKDAPAKTEQMVDYAVFFQEATREQSATSDLIASVEADIALVQQSVKLAEVQIASLDAQITKTKQDLAAAEAARDAVAAHEKAVEKKLNEVRTSVESLSKENVEKAGQIAQIQVDSARRIDARVKKVATR